MQILLTATLPNAPGEAAAKSMDTVHPESENSFMAQMGQMLQDNQEAQSAENSIPTEADKTCSDSSGATSGLTVQSRNQTISDRIQIQPLHSIGSLICQEAGNSNASDSKPVESEVSEEELNQLATSANEYEYPGEGETESERPDQLISASSPLPMYWMNVLADKSAHTFDANRHAIDSENQTESAKLIIADTSEHFFMGDGAIHASSAGYLTAVQEVSAAISSELSESGAESLKELAGTDLKMNSGTSAASEKSGAVNLKGFADANASKDSSPSTGSEKADTDNLTRFIETVPSKDSSVYTGSEKPDSGNLKGFADGDPSKDSGVSIGSEGADKDGLKRFMNSDSRSDSGVSMDSEEAYAPKQTAILETVRQNPLPIKEEAAVKDLFDTQLLQTQSNRDPVSKSISNAATDDSDTPEPTASSPDLSASEKNESHSTIAKKSERIVPASAVSVNTAESRTDQNQANHESYSRSAMQSKHETGQTSAHGKPQAMSAENKQEFHITAVSNPVQSSETGAAAFIATESASKYQSRDFIQKLADQIQVQVRDGKEEIRIQLKPDLLGRIEIRAETTLSGVTARITTESAAVKGYLENNLQLLQQTLVDLGLRLDRIQIVAQDGMDAQFSSGYGAHFGQAGTGRNGQNSNAEAEIPGFITMDAADEITLDSATRLALNPNGRFYTVA